MRRHAVDAIRNGTPRMLHIRPEPASQDRTSDDEGEHIFIPMSCASEGSTDVYVEPHVPARRLIVAGFTPVAQALAHAGAALGYSIIRVVDESEGTDLEADAATSATAAIMLDGLRTTLNALCDSERARTSAVVASQGHYDEAALDVLLEANLGFIGLVASRKRAARVFGVLEQQGCSRERIATVRNPVGLDLGARTPQDVAVSILAEMVVHAARSGSDALSVPDASTMALDPICGMEVEIAGARHRFELNGGTYYFCCAGCRSAFAADPAAALAASGNA